MSSKPSKILVVHGNDDFAVDQAARAWLEKTVPNAEAEDALSTIPGDVDTVDAALEAIKQALSAMQSLSMFSAVNVTWFRDVRFLTGPVFKSDPVKEAVEALQETLASGLGPEQVLVITVGGKLPKNSRFYKAVSQVAQVEECSRAEKPWEVEKESVARLQTALKERGISAAGPVMAALAGRIGGESRLMQQEVEKLDVYLGDRRELERQDVELMVGTRQESQVFELSDRIGHRDVAGAMALIERLETQGASPIAVMATLHNALREMGYLRSLLAEGSARLEDRGGRFGKLIFVDGDAKEGFNAITGGKGRSPFRQFQLAKQSMGFSPGQMDRMIRQSAETYGRQFRSGLPAYELIRVMVLRMLDRGATGRQAS